MQSGKIIVALLFALCTHSAFSQIAEVRTYGFSGGEERAKEIIQTSDGGYAFIGTTNANDGWNTDIVFYKLDADLNVVWNKVYGFEGIDHGISLVQKMDGGYYFLSTTLSTENAYDLQLFSIDAQGELIQTLNLGSSDWDFAIKLKTLLDGGLLILGETYAVPGNDKDVYVHCLNADLSTRWQQNLGGSEEDMAADVEQAGDGILYVLGSTLVSELPETYTFHYWKLNPDGSVIWDLLLSISGSYHARGLATMANGFVATGHEITSQGNDKFILRIDNDGNVVWDRHYPLEGNQSMADIIVLPDLGFGLTGESSTFGSGGWGIYTMEADGNGIWVAAYVFGGTEDEFGYSLILDDQLRITLVGESNSFSDESIECYLARLPGDVLASDYELDYGHFQENSFTGIADAQKLNSCEITISDTFDPAMYWSNAWLQLYDISGRMIWTGSAGNLAVQLLTPGWYFIRWEDNEQSGICRLFKYGE
jgi:hypothetical protein